MMAAPSTLLCLVSEQRMQNVIPLFHANFQFSRVILVASGENSRVNPRFARIAEDLAGAVRERAHCILWDAPVDPMVPNQTEAICREVIERYGGAKQVTINFTGGTKPMSIGAYQAGLATGCEMIYIDTQKEQIFCYHNGSLHLEPFQLSSISVSQILALHGKPINPHWTLTKQPNEMERQITQTVFLSRANLLPQLLNLQNVLRVVPRNADQEKNLPVEQTDGFGGLMSLLEQAGAVRRDASTFVIGHRTCQYLDGGWLEQYVAHALSVDGRFADVAGNLQLAGVENELDVACTLNGKLAIIECKSGKIEGGQGTQMVNRLRALKDSLAGTFGKTFLVTCYETTRLSRRFLERAREYVSKVIGFEDLTAVEQIIYDEIAGKQR